MIVLCVQQLKAQVWIKVKNWSFKFLLPTVPTKSNLRKSQKSKQYYTKDVVVKRFHLNRATSWDFVQGMNSVKTEKISVSLRNMQDGTRKKRVAERLCVTNVTGPLLACFVVIFT